MITRQHNLKYQVIRVNYDKVSKQNKKKQDLVHNSRRPQTTLESVINQKQKRFIILRHIRSDFIHASFAPTMRHRRDRAVDFVLALTLFSSYLLLIILLYE